MIIFYDKRTGEIHGTIDGRVHSETHLKCSVDNGIGKENIGSYIIGWSEEKGQKKTHNLHKFELLRRFEDLTPFSPMNCKIENGELVEKRDEQLTNTSDSEGEKTKQDNPSNDHDFIHKIK
jgi:hypothetical protein